MILTAKQVTKLSVIFEYLLREYNDHLNNKDEVIATKVLELLLECDRYLTGEEPKQHTGSYGGLVDAFNQLVQKNVKTHRSVQFYAEALHLHPNHLNFLMKKYTGTTAKHTIIDHTFLEAKHMLESTSLTVKEIAYELGFTSPGCFSSFFKKMSHIPLSKYRHQLH
jgi:AraC family transcriptional regulator, transcriptional activator of pobA